MAGRRVLFLGVTGVEKEDALHRLRVHCIDEYSKTKDEIDVIHFESDFLLSGHKAVASKTFLDGSIESQRREWSDAWQKLWDSKLAAVVESEATAPDVFLSLHGCYI